MKLTAETTIHSTMNRIWRFTQTPELHQAWDLRFNTIQYLPKTSPDDPQNFVYATQIGFGLAIEGWGKSVAQIEKKDKRTSVLSFGTEDKKSIIREGKGCWIYQATPEGIHFSTVYDYQVRFGWLGRLFDAVLFRPLMIWATRWSFDRLRLWIEQKIPPEIAFRLWVTKVISRVLLGLVWIHEGLIPKILFVRHSELMLVKNSQLYWHSPAFTLMALGFCEIGFGLWLISGYKERLTAFLTLIGLIVLPIIVILNDPMAWSDPFGGISKNLGLIACAVVILKLIPITPRAYWFKK